MQPVLDSARTRATRSIVSPSTGKQLYSLTCTPRHRQPVVDPAGAQATCYIHSPSTGNQLRTQAKHRQSVKYSAPTQATNYTGSPSTCKQLEIKPKHRQPVIHLDRKQAGKSLPSYLGLTLVYSLEIFMGGRAGRRCITSLGGESAAALKKYLEWDAGLHLYCDPHAKA